MRVAWLIALGLLGGCSEPRVDLHLVRTATLPLHGQPHVASPCEDCGSYVWLGHDGRHVEIEAERKPVLSIPLADLIEVQLSRSAGVYQPYCDLFAISADSGISAGMADSITLAHPGAPFMAVVGEEVVDAGANVFQAGRLLLTFTNGEQARRAARLLRVAPDFADVDDPTRREARENQVTLIRSLSAEEFAQLVERSGLDPDETTRDTLINTVLCP